MTGTLASRCSVLWLCVGPAIPMLAGCQTPPTLPASAPCGEVWRVDVEASAHPPVWFSFPKPFESYAGEFPRVEGELRVSGAGASGWFRVSIMEVTLGEEELDKNVRHNMEMLAGTLHPRSTFTVLAITPRLPNTDAPIDVVLQGELELKGIRAPVKAPAVMTFAKGKPARLRGGFSIESLRDRFSVVGPGVEGEPAGNRVEVMFDVGLVQDKSGGAAKPGDRT